MGYSKAITTLLVTVVCATVSVADAGAQSRGRSGGRHSGGGRGPAVGRAVPRSGGAPRVQGYRGGDRRGSYYGSRVIVAPRVVVGAPLRSYYYPYYGYRSGVSIGFYRGFGYGYPYYGSAFGYPYAYGTSYGGYYPYGYGSRGYGYGSYGAGVGYGGEAYGGIRIQGASRGAQVYVDGYYAGIVDDFDGTFQRLQLEDGAHQIELRADGFPPLTYDVNVQPGRTLTIHANVR